MAYKMTAQGLKWVADAPAQALEEYKPPARTERSLKPNAEKVGQRVATQQQQPVRSAPIATAQPVGRQPPEAATNIRQAATNIRPAAPAQPNFQQMQASMPQTQPIQQIQAPQPVSMPTLKTNSTADPNSTRFLQSMRDRVTTQERAENAPVTASAERAINLARRDIGDASAAEKKKKQEELLARGLSSGAGAGAGQVRAIDEAARTRGARASSDIALGRERDQDQLNLARTGMTNSLYGQLGQASQVPFSQQLQGNQQALDTWKANEAAQLGRAQVGVQAQSANAQIQAQQQAQQMAMWNALMGMAR